MRTFTVGHGPMHKFVALELEGSHLRVTKGTAYGILKRVAKDYGSEAAARSRSEEMIRELVAHGYAERKPEFAAMSRPAEPSSKPAAPPNRPARPVPPPRPAGLDDLLAEAGEEEAEAVKAPLPRVAASPAAGPSPSKKAAGKKKKKKRKGKSGGDELDKRVIAGFGAFGVLCVAFVGYLAYAAFLKPPTIAGHWEGSRTEHEIGKFLTNTQFVLILDDKKNASMSVNGMTPSNGTYTLQGDRLKLAFKAEKVEKGEEGEEGEEDLGDLDREFKVALGGSTLDLFDPATGKKVVQLIRFHKQIAAGRAPSPPAAAPKDLAGGPADKAAEEALASVPYRAKDGAFRLRHPSGWEEEDGSRADNSYSWVRYTKGSAKIKVSADVAGSLTSGPNSSDYEEGSPMAPVHGAHERYKRNVSEDYSDYKESEPAPFKGSGLGEGRISTFTASGGGVFGSKISGIRVTLLTNDRRITILCEGPPKEFEKLKATFLATCRSLSR